MKFLAAGLVLLVGCAGTSIAPDSAEAGATAERLLPTPSEPLELAALEGKDLAAWLEEWARIGGFTLVVGGSEPQTQERLAAIPAVHTPGGQVPPEQVHSLVEAVLLRHHLFLEQLLEGSRPTVSVHSMFNLMRGRYQHLEVPFEGRHLLKQHPAFIVTMVVELPHTDVRQLTTSMRGVLNDVTTQTLLPAGKSSVIVQGVGSFVSSVVSTLLEVDDQNRAQRERTMQRADAGQAD